MIGLIDLGISNIGSVQRAFHRLGAEFSFVREPGDLAGLDALVLPGVGAFHDGMAALNAMQLTDPVRAFARQGHPLLGFCLGMQLLANDSDEGGPCEGLGLVQGSVTRLRPSPGERVPNIGWCDLHSRADSRLLASLAPDTSLYFVHSYALRGADDSCIAGTIDFGNEQVIAAVEQGQVFGLQCHPEKSQDAGLTVLENFLGIVRGPAPAGEL